MRTIGLLALALLLAAASADRPAAPVTAWARAHAVSLDDDAGVMAAIGDPRVLAVGEFTHGAREPLLLRNRLVRLLGARGALDIVALESGLVEGRRLNDYVMGGPGDAASVARRNLNWGFGAYPENVALIDWLRTHNATPGVRRIAIHGVDIPGGDDRAIGDASIAVADSVAWLRRAAAGRDEGLIAALAPHASDLSLKRWLALPPAKRADLGRLADRLVAYHARRRAALAATTSAEEETWAERTAIVLQQVIGVYRAWPPDNPAGDTPNGLFPVVEARDAAMAANTMWLLRRARRGARMLLFMHNGHVTTGPRIERVTTFPRASRVIGQRLRAALGADLTVMLTNTATGTLSAKRTANAPGSLGAALAAADARPFLIDLRRAPRALLVDRAWTMGGNMLPVPGAQATPRLAAQLIATFPAATDITPMAAR